jgi:hypothetical protein
MNPALLLILLPMALGAVAADPGRVAQGVTRLVIRDEVVWRVPVTPRTAQPRIAWVEQKGPKCVPTGAIRRAMLAGRGNVDFVLANRTRIRAKFDDDCPALDFYAGLYLLPDDDLLCAQRDSVHSRVGGSCEIEAFRLLRPTLRQEAR